LKKNKTTRITNLLENPFLKNVLVIATGTAGGQFVLLITSPFLTRIYSPEDFGVFAIYTSVLSVLVVIVSLRYNLAILVAKTYRAAIELFTISIIITILMSLGVLILLMSFGGVILEFFNLDVPTYYFFLLPISLFFLGIYQVFTQLAIRNENFKVIAKTKFVQSSILGISQLLYGFLFKSFGGLGLLIGDSTGRFSGNVTMIKTLSKKDFNLMKKIKVRSLVKTAKSYIKFPLYSSFSGLLNNGVLQMPPLILAIMFTQNVVGLFALTQRVVGVPMKMIGQSIAEVYLGECAKLSRENPKLLLKLFKNISKRLFLIAIIPFAIVLVGAQEIFAIIFGMEWREAGYYIQLLSVMYLIQFIVFPLSQTLEILEKQKTQLFWQVSRGLIIVCSLTIPPYIGMTPSQTIFLYGLAMSISYVLLYITVLFHIKKLSNDVKLY